MSDLDDLKYEQGQKENELSSAETTRASLMQTASEIGALYDQMCEQKEYVKQLKANIKTYKNTKYDGFVGNLYDNTYYPQVKALYDRYDDLVDAIDANMDALNIKRSEYENEAYRYDGIIGYLRGALNSIGTRIANWFN